MLRFVQLIEYLNKSLLISIFIYCSVGISYTQAVTKQEASHVLDYNQSQVDSLLHVVNELTSDEHTIKESLDELELAYDISRDLQYDLGIIKCCNGLGNYYLSISDNANSTLYFYLMLREAESFGDAEYVSEAYIGIGLVMFNMSKWKDAINNFDQAFKALNREKESRGRVELITYLKGLSLMHQGNYQDAQMLILSSKEYAEAKGDSMRIYETRIALNRIAVEENAGPNVLNEFDVIQSFFERRNETIGICYSMQGKALVYLKRKEYQMAYDYASKALEIAYTLDLIYPILEILTTLIETEKLSGNFSSALSHQEELNDLKDSTNSLEVATQIAMLGASHQFEKKEAAYDAEIKDKAKQRRFFLILFVGTLIIAIIIVFMLRLVFIQRRKSDKLLRNILPKATIEELNNQGHSIPKAHQDVTIVFADVVSFTTIASTLKPDILVRMLDRYFMRFDAIIQSYNLEKIKTIGDAYMFVGGLVPESDSVDRTANACLDMIDAIKGLKKEMLKEFNIHFEFRFGMHTGNVVSGVVGDIKYAFDIWGDAVNIASRMEENSDAMKINISHETKRLLKDNFNCLSRGSFKIKNRGEIEMFYLERPN